MTSQNLPAKQDKKNGMIVLETSPQGLAVMGNITKIPIDRVEELRVAMPPIRTFPSQDFKSKQWTLLGTALLKCAQSVGIQDPPDKNEILNHISFIFRQFADFNVLEIVEAFDLYCSRSLDFKGEHYNNFNILFVGNVLSSYKRHKTHTLSLLKRPSTFDEKKHKLTLGEIVDYFERELFTKLDAYKKDQKGAFPWSVVSANGLFRKLEDLKIIELSVEEKKAIRIDVIKKMMTNIATLVKKKNAKKTASGEFEIENAYIRQMCRFQSFKLWIQEMVFSEEDVKQMVIDAVNKQQNEDNQQKK